MSQRFNKVEFDLFTHQQFNKWLVNQPLYGSVGATGVEDGDPVANFIYALHDYDFVHVTPEEITVGYYTGPDKSEDTKEFVFANLPVWLTKFILCIDDYIHPEIPELENPRVPTLIARRLLNEAVMYAITVGQSRRVEVGFGS